MFNNQNSNPQASSDVKNFAIRSMKDDLNNPQDNNSFSNLSVKNDTPIEKKEEKIIKPEKPALETKTTATDSPFLKAAPEKTINYQAITPNTPNNNPNTPPTSSNPKLESVLASFEKSQTTDKPQEKPLTVNLTNNEAPVKAPSQTEKKDLSAATNSFLSPNYNSNTTSSGGTNKLLLAIATIVFIATIGAGVYYYFFVLSAQPNQPLPLAQEPANNTINQNPDSTTPAENIPSDNTAPTIPPTQTNSLIASAQKMIINPAELTLSIKKFLTENPSAAGVYQLTDNKNTPFNPQDILGAFKINLAEIQPQINDAALFIPTAKNPALILSLSSETGVSDKIKATENTLPTKLAGLFIDGQPKTELPIVFADGRQNPNVRFYNFTSNDPTKSIDWVILNNNGTSYLIFATSRESMQEIIQNLGKN